MPLVSYFTKQSLGRKIGEYVCLAGAALFVYGGVALFNRAREASGRDKNSNAVVSAIRTNEFGLAEKLLSGLDETELRTRDRITAENLLEKAEQAYEENKKAKEEGERKNELTSKFDSLIKFGKEQEARAALEQIVNSGLFLEDTIDCLAERLQDISEKAFYEKARKELRIGDVSLTEQYLEIYPEGERSKEIAESLVVHQFAILSEYFQSTANLDITYSHVQNLDSLLERFPESIPVVKKILPVEDILGKEQAYLEEVSTNVSGLSIGCKAKVVEPNEAISRQKGYYEERTKAIPYGSVGTLIDIKGEDLFVRFPKTRTLDWDLGYSELRSYFDKGWKVAIYNRKELEALPNVNLLDKYHFSKQMERLNKKLGGENVRN